MEIDNNKLINKVSICIATCRRIQYLTILLNKIGELVIPDNLDLTVIVVDNDPEKSAQVFVTNLAVNYRFKLVYGVQTKRGIPQVRNMAVSLAEKDSDFIAFIDDDEYPDKNWIFKLLEIQKETDAELVQGPVFPEFVEEPPLWIKKGNFFVLPFFKFETGSNLEYWRVSTNNLLVKYNKLMKINGPFDEKMGLIGGEDNLLGVSLNKLGCKMVYTRDAIVHEFIPKSRMSVKWLLQRAYRTANTHWLLTPNKNIISLLKLTLGAIARIIICSVLLLPALVIAPVTGIQHVVNLLRLILRGVAIIAGVLGIHYEEYKFAYTVPSV